ncbi:MAG: VanZ family protein [Bacteroidaceae bacterium]|nr:VanZ family protein [Bacteroidaceae bacterium]
MIRDYIKNYRFSLFCIVLIWVLSLMPVPETNLAEDIPFIDKWTHIVMYLGTCSIIWIEYYLKHKAETNKIRLLIGAIILPILMSGILELLQEYCTGGLRNGDWIDLAANTTGVVLAAILGVFLFRRILIK